MNSFLSYMGGKSLLTKKIIPLIPQHQCYCEVFSGAAWLLFRKEESEVEIIDGAVKPRRSGRGYKARFWF